MHCITCKASDFDKNIYSENQVRSRRFDYYLFYFRILPNIPVLIEYDERWGRAMNFKNLKHVVCIRFNPLLIVTFFAMPLLVAAESNRSQVLYSNISYYVQWYLAFDVSQMLGSHDLCLQLAERQTFTTPKNTKQAWQLWYDFMSWRWIYFLRSIVLRTKKLNTSSEQLEKVITLKLPVIVDSRPCFSKKFTNELHEFLFDTHFQYAAENNWKHGAV